MAAFFVSFHLLAQQKQQFDFNQNCIQAYEEIIALNFNAGNVFIKQERLANPDNKILALLENYIDFLTLAIGESKTDFERLKPNRSMRIDYLQQGETNSPWYGHSLAAIYLQWSFVRMKFGEYVQAGLDLNRAYRILSDNRKQFPDFVPDLLLDGVLDALIGSIPPNYAWAVRLVGLQGEIESGRTKLYRLVDISNRDPNWAHLQGEAFFYLSFIEINLQSSKQQTAALLETIERSNFEGGSLACFIKSNLMLRLGLNDDAISTIENCRISDGAFPFHYLEFVLGNAKLNRLDNDTTRHFLNFINHFRGLNYIKTAYQRLAWASLINGDANAYRFYISKIPDNGQAFVDEDKQAEAEAHSGKIPNRMLLKARLLFDGGYYERAIAVLNAEDENLSLTGSKDSVEFIYRKARIYHEWGRTEMAKDYYEQTIQLGSRMPYYFAGNSAYLLGLMYENKDDLNRAAHYYDACLAMPFTEYRSSIQQKARIGRQRVTQK